ncbi:MAG: hypothetical protein QME64_02375 [bacterium]|nr:hypothetical protein [bacterium]
MASVKAGWGGCKVCKAPGREIRQCVLCGTVACAQCWKERNDVCPVCNK